MKVSIVIPAYNEERWIEKTIRAALAQNYPEFEVIVVNNASTDRTEEIAKTFPVTVIREDTQGLLHAREAGRRVAKGEIIAQLDADCLPNKNWLSLGMSLFKKADIVAVSGPYDYYDAGLFFRGLNFLVHGYVYYVLHTFSRLLRRGGFLTGGNALIRASALKAMGGYTTSILFWGEDLDTAKKLSKEGTVLFVPTFSMWTSARRFRSEGFLRSIGNYLGPFLKALLLR